MNLTYPVAPSIVGFATTIHLAMLVLRWHRSPSGAVTYLVGAISFLFTASPWTMPTPVGLAAGLAAHLAWFAACEKFLTVHHPAPAGHPAPASGSAGKPAVPRPKGIAHAARQPRAFVQAPVIAVFDETPDIRTFRIARPEGFDFKPGQFLTVRLRAEGREHVRCYSISSPPSRGGHMEISVKRIGLVSGALHASVRPGSLLSVRPPAGSFVYPMDDERPLVLLAGGVGITPLMAMLRHAVEAEPARPVTLFYSVRKVEDIAFHDELTLLARRHDHVRIFFAVSEGDPGPGHFPGVISESLITTMVPDVTHAVCMICGPQPMMNAMTATLASLGVPKGQIRFEIFQAAVAASALPHGTAEAPLPVGETDHALHDVTFTRSGRTVQIQGGETLLEAAERCGTEIPTLCRAGVCGTCRTRVLDGDAHCSSAILDDDDRAAGYVLPCVTHVTSNCQVEA
jgi:ferredoxin-NADP reductase